VPPKIDTVSAYGSPTSLAGNFTLVGSVANLIVAQRAKARGVELNFWAYFKVGGPLTVLTIAFGLLWL
jgi:Na+/H+ antiporter NhaD/arsenite permease-like protein